MEYHDQVHRQADFNHFYTHLSHFINNGNQQSSRNRENGPLLGLEKGYIQLKIYNVVNGHCLFSMLGTAIWNWDQRTIWWTLNCKLALYYMSPNQETKAVTTPCHPHTIGEVERINHVTLNKLWQYVAEPAGDLGQFAQTSMVYKVQNARAKNLIVSSIK